MIGLDLFLTVAMGYVTYINYKSVGPRNMWTILSATCFAINAYGLYQRF